jgi:hypothetical protein
VILFLADLALFLAATTAIALAFARPLYWPLALFLFGAMLADWIRRGLAAGPLAAPGPYTGLTRSAFHVEQALLLAWPFGLAALAWIIFGRRSPRLAARLYLVTAVALAAAYPHVRGPRLRLCYLAIEIATLLAAAAAVAVWAWRRERPRLEHGVVLCLLGVGAAKLKPVWGGDLFTSWARSWPMHAALYAGITLLHVGALWPSSSSR